MAKQIQIIVAQISILATIQLIGFIGSFGILNASAAGNVISQSIAQITPSVGDAQEGAVSSKVTITGFSQVTDTCEDQVTTGCEIQVHYSTEISAQSDSRFQVSAYLSGPDMNNQVIGTDTVGLETTSSSDNFSKKITPQRAGYYKVKVVILDIADMYNISSQAQTSFYSAAAESTTLGIELASFKPEVFEQKKAPVQKQLAKNTVKAIAVEPNQVSKQPIKEAVSQPIVGSSTKTVSKQVTSSPTSKFTYTYSKKVLQTPTPTNQNTVTFRDTNSTQQKSSQPTPQPTEAKSLFIYK